MLKKIILILAALIAILVVIILMQPEDFKISRSATMAATPQAVFEQVNDYHKWQDWSPWAKLDPDAKVTFAGPPTGMGSSFAWVGDSNVGEGKQTIVESRPNELIRMKLEFLKPFEATSEAEFSFKPEGTGTHVTWTMSGKNNFVGKAISLVASCDQMVGGFFEQGLGSIKKIVEPSPKP